MEIRIEERSDEVLFFMKPEDIKESALLLRLGGSMMNLNSGYVGFYGERVSGWLKMPLKKKKCNSISSGKGL